MISWPVMLAILTIAALFTGFPVGFVLAGCASLVAFAAIVGGTFDPALLQALPGRLWQIFTNPYFTAIPPFILLGLFIDRAGLAAAAVAGMVQAFGHSRFGLNASIILAGGLLAAVTGIVGASVIALTLIAAPLLLNARLSKSHVAGLVCATGTLGQIIPPSIVLLLLADVIHNANAEAELARGNFAPDPVTVIDLFAASLLPGLLLIAAYLLWSWLSSRRDQAADSGVEFTEVKREANVIRPGWAVSAMVGLIAIVLGGIFSGIVTVTEAAALGAALAAMIAAFRCSRQVWFSTLTEGAVIAGAVFTILLGATVWSLVFRGLGGDALVADALSTVPGGLFGALLVVMAAIFVAGFFLEIIEILLIFVPLTAPALIMLGADPVWLAVLIALNLQTSFLTPPMGISLFYFKSAAPPGITTLDIYKGVVPFVIMQLLTLLNVALMPAVATGLPSLLFD